MDRAELRLAFTWDCPACGAKNASEGKTIDPETITLDDLPEDIEPGQWLEWDDAGGSGGWIVRPDEVACRSCGREFDVTGYDDE